MPRHADPEQRRDEVVTALFRVVAAEGLEAASIPRIARELGATTGLVQTYFRSKDELLLVACRVIGERMRKRVRTAIATHDGTDVAERLRRGMHVLTGASADEQDGEVQVWLAFLARAAFHPGLRERHIAGAEEIRGLCQELLEAAQEQGRLSRDTDPRAAAVALGAFVDGITVQRALEPELLTTELAGRLLQDYLDRLFR